MLVCDWCRGEDRVREMATEVVASIVPGDEELHHGIFPDVTHRLDLCETCGKDLLGRMAVLWDDKVKE